MITLVAAMGDLYSYLAEYDFLMLENVTDDDVVILGDLTVASAHG